MGKIIINIDSVVQTKKETDNFTKKIVDIIKGDLTVRDVFVEVSKLENNYNLKAYLPETM